MSRPRYLLVLGLLALSLLLGAILSLGVGAIRVPLADVGSVLLGKGADWTSHAIIWELRLPRVLLAMLIGAGLAAAGTAYQGLFRNPLADPFVIGASSGAALGATVAVVTVPGGEPFAALPIVAFGGALGAVGLVYTLGGAGMISAQVTLLLAGAAVSTVFGSAVSLLMIFNDESLHVVFGWLMGGLSGRGWEHVAWGTPLMVGGLVWIWTLSRPLDALALGEKSAQGLGLSIVRTRLALVGAATLATATAVAIAGMIGFVGLMAPHAARTLFGPAHSRLLPASSLLGALLLLVADDLARSLAAPMEIPVGIVTSLLGGPFFLYLLRRHQRREDIL